MNTTQAKAFLTSKGFSELEVFKTGGIYYLVGGEMDERLPNQGIERCLHIVRQAQLTPEVLTWKLEELGFKTAN